MRLAYGGFGVDFQHGDPPAVVKLGSSFSFNTFLLSPPLFQLASSDRVGRTGM